MGFDFLNLGLEFLSKTLLLVVLNSNAGRLNFRVHCSLSWIVIAIFEHLPLEFGVLFFINQSRLQFSFDDFLEGFGLLAFRGVHDLRFLLHLFVGESAH